MSTYSYELTDYDYLYDYKKLSDKDKVLKYFECEFGDEMTLFKVMAFDLLDDWCEFNHIDKSFVIQTIKEYKC